MAPPAPGTVRMYHGGSAYAGGSRWLTPNLQYAQGYANKSPGAFVHYVDVSEHHPGMVDTNSGYGQKVWAHFNAPASVASQLRPLAGTTSPARSAPVTTAPASSGGKKFAPNLDAYLAKVIQNTAGHPRVSVGFLHDATYPDGTSIAAVAAANEFGVPSHNQPPRPFFRLMVAEKSGGWPAQMATALKATDYDVHKTLSGMGQSIVSELQDSIETLVDPPLAQSTIDRKGFDKPLIDTTLMRNKADYRVED